MSSRLNARERRAVKDLLAWDRTKRKADLIASYLALVLGGLTVVVVTLYTVGHLDDWTIYRVTLQGFVSAMFFFVIYAIGSARAKEKHRLASIVRKLEDRIV